MSRYRGNQEGCGRVGIIVSFLLAGYIYTPSQIISRFTVASCEWLEKSGFILSDLLLLVEPQKARYA